MCFDGNKISITVSSGYALHDFRSSFNFDELLKCADKYLYQSKKQGRDLHTGGVADQM